MAAMSQLVEKTAARRAVDERAGPGSSPLAARLNAASPVRGLLTTAQMLNGRSKAVAQRAPNRTGLPNGLKAGVEAMSGFSLDDVRVHRNSPKPAQLRAHAYAQGADIHLAPGQDHHLPHEAWHVVQQKQGRVRATAQLKGVALNDDAMLEREADLKGREAARHRGARSVVPAMPIAHGEPASAAPAQRILDVSLVNERKADGRAREIIALAREYNHGNRGKSREQRIDQIEQLQSAILASLNRFDAPDQDVSGLARWAKRLLNAVQVEHEKLVRASVDNNDAQPPVADFAKLSPEEQARVTRIWRQLVNQSGNIRITETEDYTNSDTGKADSRVHGNFRYEVLAQFARLLRTATGREVVDKVNRDTGGRRLVTIKPGFAEPSQGAPGSEFAAGPTVTTGADKLTAVDPDAMFKGVPNGKRKRAAFKRKFVHVNLTKADAGAIYAAREANPRATGVEIGGKYYRFGAGSGVDVTITRDVRDAVDHHTSRLVDSEKNEIPAPNFITLGHELGHAAHMLTGAALGDQTVSSRLLPAVGVHGATAADWSDLEEFGNINAVENALRGDYGLKPRYGHINQSTVQRGRLNKIIDQFYALSDLQPNAHRAPVAAHLGAAGLATAGLKIPAARIAIEQAATAFSGNMAAAFPRFNGHETAAVRAELTRLSVNVKSAAADKLAAALADVNEAHRLVTNARNRVAAPPPAAAPRGFSLWSLLGY